MKTLCIYHKIDLDGWMSAAIVKFWHKDISFTKDNLAIQGVEAGPIDEISFFGFNYGDSIDENILEGVDRVVMCDISLPLPMMEKFRSILQNNFIWIDHHISAIKEMNSGINTHYEGLRDISFAACENTWKYFYPDTQIPEIVRLLGRYDCFGHKGTAEETKVLEFQYGARSIISSYEDAYQYLIQTYNTTYWKDTNASLLSYIQTLGNGIYGYLCKEALSVVKNGFAISLNEYISEGEIAIRKFLCINRDRFNPSNFGLNYHKKGYDGVICFSLYNDTWSFSLYNENGEVDCSAIAKLFGGGGHKGAAGFRLKPGDSIDSFLNPRRID